MILNSFTGVKFKYTVDEEMGIAEIEECDTLTNIKTLYTLQVAKLREKVMEEALAKLGYKLVKIDE